jgi:putative nucleotidyltransferase with HDIG domain
MHTICKVDFITAALLHDIGHLIPGDQHPGLGRVAHQHVGAEYLRSLGFNETVVELVGSHVEAKRYLVAKNSDYHRTLSDASKETLKLQGGPMTMEEVVKFEADPLFEVKLLLRQCDEKAKIPNMCDLDVDPFAFIDENDEEAAEGEYLPSMDSYANILYETFEN